MTSVEHELIRVPELRPLLAALDSMHDALVLSMERRDRQLTQRILHLLTQLTGEIDQLVMPSTGDGANASLDVEQSSARLRRETTSPD